MSTAPFSKRLKLKELTDDGVTNSYNEFSHKGKLELQAMGYWKFIEGTQSAPPVIPQLKRTQKIKGPDETGTARTIVITGNEMEVQKAMDDAVPWREGDLKALNAIIQAMPGTKLHLVQSAKTAKEAWESLKAEYRSVNTMRAARLKSYILGYKFVDGYKMANWRDDMQRMYQELRDVDDTALPDDEFARHLVTMMPISDRWRYLHSELSNKVRGAAPGTLRSSEILWKLRDEDEGIQASNDEPSVLMTARAEFLQSKSGNKRPRDAEVNQSTPATAPISKRARTSFKLQCTNPHCPNPRSRHTIDNCFAFGGGKCGDYPPWWSGPRDIHLHPDKRSADTNSRSMGAKRGSAHVASINHTREYSQPGSEVKYELAEVKCWYLMPSCRVTGCYSAVCSKL